MSYISCNVGNEFNSLKSLNSGAIANTKTINKAVFLMGGAGAGKGTIRNTLLKKHPEYLVIDPDQIKESMPEYQTGLKNKEKSVASRVHEKSVALSKEALINAIREEKSFIYDSTGGRVDDYKVQMSAAKEKGMKVKLIYVDTEVFTCLARVKEREVKTGRNVPDDDVMVTNLLAQMNFTELRTYADSWKRYNNNGEKPKLEESSKLV